MGSSEELETLRKKIDEVDNKILELLNDRARFAIDISRLKKKNSYDIYDPVREREIEKNIKSRNGGPLSNKSVVAVFREIISSCRTIQRPISVSYLGPSGSYSHQAAFNEFSSSAHLIPCDSFEEVFEEVERERGSSFGIVPVENSMEGSVGSVLDMLSRTELRVSSEYFERISHCLLSKTGNIKDIKVVASHPQALGQCRKWLSKNLKNVEFRETASTARGAQLASRNKKVAAIAGEFAASLYKLKFLEKQIEDNVQNTTRFWIMSKMSHSQTGDDKTSILFSLKDEPGALQKSLFLPFAEAKVNLTRIESRPSKERAWEYIFFVDFIGHEGDKKIQKLLSRVKKRCTNLKVLGSYPRGESEQ
ncbi:prephenate dehydratase [Desulfobacterota bacterium AH_259_B03_O07]|nr:prephenate dehydratase [Desulfobacterota bacterium AH_259_B03_O07]